MSRLLVLLALAAALAACAPAPADAGKPVVYRAAMDDVQRAILEAAPNMPYDRNAATLQLESVRAGEIAYRLHNEGNASQLLVGRLNRRAVFTLYGSAGLTYVTGSGNYPQLVDFVISALDKRFERVRQP